MSDNGNLQQAEQGGNTPPKVQPDVSLWDMREVKGSWLAKTAEAVRGGLFPTGVVAAVFYAIHQLLRAEGIDSGTKVVGTIALVLVLGILGMAMHLNKGAKTHAETAKDNANQPSDS